MAEGGMRPQIARALAQHLWGIFHAYEGRYDEAAAAFEQAVELEPEMTCSYVELGMVYACRGDYARMVEALGRAVGIGLSAVRAYLGEQPLGDISTGPSVVAAAISHLAAGRDEEAARELERESARESGSAPATVMLTLSYLLRGESVEADGQGVRRVPAPPAAGE